MSICCAERANAFRRFLPQFIQNKLENEEQQWKTLIFENLPKAIENNNYEEIDFWITTLENYTEFETFTFTPEEVEKIATILYNFIITTQHMNLLTSACATFILIVNPQHIKINLEIDWHILYDLLYDAIISHSKTKTRKYPPKMSQTLISMIRISRSYFPETSTDEMLLLWEHMLDPYQHTFILAQCLLSLFLPVNHGQHNKWLQKFLDLWTVYRSDYFDFQFLSIFARLSRYGYKDIPWDRILPFLFNVMCLYLEIPSTLLSSQITQITNYHPELYMDFFKDLESPAVNFRLFSIIVINLLTGETQTMAREYVERMFHLISPFCTASVHNEDEVQCEGPVEFLNEFVYQYVRRYQKEKKYGATVLEPLTQEDNEWLVSNVLPLILMEQFHEDPQFSYINDIVQLAPSMAIYPLLNTVKSTFEHLHLKQGAYQTLVALAPTIIYTKEGLEEFMMILEKHLPEDLNFMDTLKSSVVFSLGSVVASSMKFTEENESFITEITKKCILFVKHAIGDDYINSLAELVTMLGCIVHSSPPEVAYRLAQLIRDEVDTLPDTCISSIIEPLSKYSVKAFSSIALNPTKLKDYIILEAMIKQNQAFLLEKLESIKAIIKEGLDKDDKKIQKRSIRLIKWVLKNMLSIYPIMPTATGITDMNECKQQWHIPSEKEIDCSISVIEFAIEIMKKKFECQDRKEHKIATGIGKSILKGMQASLSDFDFEHEDESELLTQPPIEMYSIKKLVNYYESVFYYLLEIMEKKETHEAIIQRILQTILQTIIPHNPLANNIDSINNDYRIHCQLSRLSTLLPPLQSVTHLVIYNKSLLLFTVRSSIKKNYVTKMMRKVTEVVYKFAPFQHKRIRNLVNIYFGNLTSQFRTQFVHYLERSIPFIEDPKTDKDSLSGYCNVASSLGNLDISMKNLELLKNTALAVCRQLPKEVPEDSARHLRQVVVYYLDQIDPYDPRLDRTEFLKIREELASEAIRRHAKYPAFRETQNYAAALASSVFVGNPYLLKLPYFQFFLSIMTTDDNLVRECIVQFIPTSIEKLIPRVPRPNGVRVDEVTPENYDIAMFIDRPFREQAKMMPHFMSEDEMMDHDKLKYYLNSEDKMENDVEERIKINRLLFEKLCHDQTIIDKLIQNLVDGQIHKEETFLKNRVLFWSTFCRFFGLPFVELLINKLYKMIEPGVSLAHHVIAAEIFAGCIHSLKSRKYKEVEKMAGFIKPFVTKLIYTIDPEFHSVWYFAFYASFTDIDPRRIFWLYDHILTCVPKGDGLRAARSVSLICDILLDAAYNIPSLRSKIEDIAYQPLFSKESLDFEQIRECSVRALSSILAISFDPVKRGYNEESYRILDRFIKDSPDSFIIRWLIGQYSTQSTSAIASGGYVVDHLNDWVNFILDKDENEERVARTALMDVANSNWIGSICKLPISLESVKEVIDKVLKALDPTKKPWQVYTVQLILTESFLGSTFFFIDEKILEDMIEDRVKPGLLNQHPDVQNAASQLLSFVVKSSLQLRDKLPDIVQNFTTMLKDRESLTNRIAGAKGLGSIITGTVLFDDVPQYVIDSFSALTEQLEIDTSVESIITQFLSDFWAVYDNNLKNNIAEILAPFHASLRPSYFC